MNKIFNYIKAGRGIGAKFLLIYAFIVAIVYASSVKIMGNEIVPVLQNAADQLLRSSGLDDLLDEQQVMLLPPAAATAEAAAAPQQEQAALSLEAEPAPEEEPAAMAS